MTQDRDHGSPFGLRGWRPRSLRSLPHAAAEADDAARLRRADAPSKKLSYFFRNGSDWSWSMLSGGIATQEKLPGRISVRWEGVTYRRNANRRPPVPSPVAVGLSGAPVRAWAHVSIEAILDWKGIRGYWTCRSTHVPVTSAARGYFPIAENDSCFIPPWFCICVHPSRRAEEMRSRVATRATYVMRSSWKPQMKPASRNLTVDSAFENSTT